MPERNGLVYSGNSSSACSRAMYSAHQAGQLGSACPIRFSCCRCASAARIIAWARSAATMTATSDIYNRIMDINVRGVFFSMKHQIPAILQSGGGAIVNNASVLALRPDANSPIYSASKAAVVALTKSAALEFAPKGVLINAICPAIIETDLTKQIRGDEQSRALLMSRHPVGRSRCCGSLPLFTGSILYYWRSLTY